MKKNIIRITFIAIIHFILTALFVFIGLNFETNILGPSTFEDMYVKFCTVLMSPLVPILESLPAKSTNFINPKWVVYPINSILWGLFLNIIFISIRKLKSKVSI